MPDIEIISDDLDGPGGADTVDLATAPDRVVAAWAANGLPEARAEWWRRRQQGTRGRR